MVAPKRALPTIHPAAYRPPSRSLSASASTIEAAQCTDNIAANPSAADGSYPRFGGSAGWSDASSIYTSNNTYASVTLGTGQKSKYLRAGGFALSSLPDDAIVRGVVVSIRRYSIGYGPIAESAVTLAKEDNLIFSNRATGATVGSTLAVASYGSSTDLWGEDIPVASEFKAANFGVLVGYDNNYSGDDIESYVLVDHIELTLYYDPAPDCSGVSVTSSWAGSSGGTSWTNPQNAAGSPGNGGATVSIGSGGHSEYITLSNFSFSTIPSNHVILGVRVRLDVKVTGACQKWHYMNMFDGSTQMPCRPKFMFVEPTPGSSYAELYYGHCEDTWPYLPNGPYNCFEPAQFSSSFILILKVENLHGGTTSVDLDAVQVSVWHAAP